MAPQYVKPFLRRQKNDTNDAEAICTAVRQQNMRFVPEHAVRAEEDSATAGHPSAAPRAAAIGQSSNRTDQPDARTLARPRDSDRGIGYTSAGVIWTVLTSGLILKIPAAPSDELTGLMREIVSSLFAFMLEIEDGIQCFDPKMVAVVNKNARGEPYRAAA
jgi:transposase